MNFAVPFPILRPEESVDKILADYIPFRDYIDYFYFRIPYIEGRDNSALGKLYADKCRRFISMSRNHFRCVLDLKINASRPSINRYFRSNYVPDVIARYGFDGIFVRDVGNLVYFTENLARIDNYFLVNDVDGKMLALLRNKASFAEIVVAGLDALEKCKDISYADFRIGYIVNEACYENCSFWQLMYSGRVNIDGFCSDCSYRNVAQYKFYCIFPEGLDAYSSIIDTVILSGALRDSCWVRNVFLSYVYRKTINFCNVLNGPLVNYFYER